MYNLNVFSTVSGSISGPVSILIPILPGDASRIEAGYMCYAASQPEKIMSIKHPAGTSIPSAAFAGKEHPDRNDNQNYAKYFPH